MKRILISVIAALPLAIGPAVASAHDNRPGNGGSLTPIVSVAGTVVSTDAANGTFVADAFVLAPRSGTGHREHGSSGRSSRFGGDSSFTRRSAHEPMTAPTAMTQVTITTDSGTKLKLNHQDGTVGDLVAGDRFVARLSGSPGDSIQTLVSNPALRVSASTPPKAHQLYAFVGRVTAVDTTAGNVTVDVTRSRPSDLVPPGSAPLSFTVGSDTLIRRGTGLRRLLGASLGDVSVGDIVAGGVIGDSVIGDSGLTLSQVESTPLKVLLDLPATTTTTTSAQAAEDKTRAMKHALSLLGDKSARKSEGHKKSH